LRGIRFLFGVLLSIAFAHTACADGPSDPTAVKQTSTGEYLDGHGSPTYKVTEDGKVDWYTYSGYRRYHADCHVCHGPDGLGSTYAPALKDSLKTIGYGDFLVIVAGGRENVTTSQENVMPAFGNNHNVVCYLDDIYVYLRARSNDVWGRARPSSHEDKTDDYRKHEESCMDGK